MNRSRSRSRIALTLGSMTLGLVLLGSGCAGDDICAAITDCHPDAYGACSDYIEAASEYPIFDHDTCASCIDRAGSCGAMFDCLLGDDCSALDDDEHDDRPAPSSSSGSSGGGYSPLDTYVSSGCHAADCSPGLFY